LLSAVAQASSVVVELAYLKVKLFLLLVELEVAVDDEDEVDDEVGSDPVQPGSRGPPTCVSSERDSPKRFARTSRNCSSSVSSGPT
jgi:hypothetical protein